MLTSSDTSTPTSAPVPNPGQTVRRSTLGSGDLGSPASSASSASSASPVSSVSPEANPQASIQPQAAAPSRDQSPALEAVVGVPAQPGAVPADLGRRLAAYLIDAAITGGALMVAYMIMVVGLFASALSGSTTLVSLITYGGLALYLALSAVVAVYYLRGTGNLGQTIGKRVLGLRVIDVQSGRPIGPGRAFGRYLYLMFMGLPCYLGYITLFTDSSGWHRGWHDTMSRTIVESVPPVPFGQATRDLWAVMLGRTVTSSP